MLFFTAQNSNYVGRLNPKTGEIKVVQNADGARQPVRHGDELERPFRSSAISDEQDHRIDPDTLAIKEYVLPNPESRPRRIAISPDDVIWYADYSRGYRRAARSEHRRVMDWPSPSGPKSQPYGHYLLERRDLVRRIRDQAERGSCGSTSRHRNSRPGSSRAAGRGAQHQGDPRR